MKLIDKIFKKFEDKNRQKDDYKTERISKSLKNNFTKVENMLGNSPDFKKRDFYIDREKNYKIGILYMNGMIDQNYVNETIIDAVISNYRAYKEDNSNLKTIEFFREFLITITEFSEAKYYGELFNSLLGGDTIILVDGEKDFFILGTRKYEERAISEPTTHISVVGPKDSFTENILTNATLIRRRIKNPQLWIKKYNVGTETNTDVAIVYLEGYAEPKLVEEVKKRIKSADIKSVIDSSYIVNLIRDKEFSIFPTVYATERPDVICANILEGRVAILVDGSPFVLVTPAVFTQFFQSVSDFYHKSYVASFFRTMRLIGFYIALLLPGLYISLTSMHSELVPFELLVRIAAQRSGIPFPSFIEALILTITYDVLREAGVRMPTALGNAISIVGALILGEAAVNAGIVSPMMVIITSGTAITTLVIPNYNMQLAVTIVKYIFILLATLFGLLGITLGVIILYVHLCSIRSFGVSFFSPLAPFSKSGIKDSFIRLPYKKVLNKEKNFNEQNPN